MLQGITLLLIPALSLAAPQVGFGDASDQEIADIRSGNYLEDFDDNPQYAFNYKVADEEQQTYMAMEEQRAGEIVTGTYSYVDPEGSLIIVNYSAGPDGYTETRDVQRNYVTIRARPVRTQSVNTVNSVAAAEVQRVEAQRKEARRQEAQRLEAQRLQRLETQRLEAQRLEAQRLEATRLEAQAAANSQTDLVTQIVAQIQPLVSQTVSSAVSGQPPTSGGGSRFPPRPSQLISFPSRVPLASVTAPRPIARVRVPAPSLRLRGNTGSASDITAVFGQGGNYNVRFNTPDFNIEY